MNKIIESTKRVAENAQHVQIHLDRLYKFADAIEIADTLHWSTTAPFDFNTLTLEERYFLIFLIDSLNFCYWGSPKWSIEVDRKKLGGAFSMVYALTRAVEQGKLELRAEALANMSRENFADILAANVEIPLFEERLEIVYSVGKILQEKFDRSVSNLVNVANFDALKLLDLVVDSFPSFRDEGIYKGEKVYFYKRAQLFVSDVIYLSGKKWKNTEELTAFSDYKLPFVLRRSGIFSYSDKLAEKIDGEVELAYGSEKEVELRAATLWVVELMKERVKERIPGIKSTQIGDYLWLLGREKTPEDKPHHHTRTIAY